MQPLAFCEVFTSNTLDMKKYWALVVVVFSFLTAFAQQTETRELGVFSGVKVAEGIDVILKQGEKEQARIEVSGTDASNVITEISGSYLRIHMRDGRYRTINAKVYVTYVRLNKLSASSAGNIYSEGPIQANSIEISASSAGSVEVSIDAASAEVSSSSAGDVELKGKVRKLIIEASSAGQIDAYDLDAEEVEVEVASAGSIKVNVRKSLYARASSGGSIRYRGNPDRSNTNSSSGGSVKKTN